MWSLITIVVMCLTIARSEYKYETKWFTVPLDHFSYQRNETFKIKYLEYNDYWDRDGQGPIFFYTGNEGQIEVFANYTGFVWEIAQEYRAKVVFAEHRYYGKSMPFGNKSLDNEHIGYLTSSQALADYADLVNYLQEDNVTPRYPVIAFGGSYGGMLAAYFRIKYPHVVAGAIAASAPIHMFPGMMPCDVFNRIITSSYAQADTHCSDNIRKSWKVISNFTATNANASDWFKTNWHLCDPLKDSSDLDLLFDFLTNMYTTLAMVNYPFACNFLVPLPAYPVRVSCQHLNKSLDGVELLKGIGKVLEIYTNYNDKKECVDTKQGDDYGNLDASGWSYQACTEMVMPMCATGKADMFNPAPWNFTKYSQGCHKQYNVSPRPNDARLNYGGALLQGATNIVFSNGLLDPWAAGGVLNSVSESVKAVVIPDSAHHLDLMPANEADPEPVRMARAIHKQNINKWINEFSAKRHRASRFGHSG